MRFINGTVEATSWKQPIMRLQRPGRTAKYAANGDVRDLIPRHAVGYATALNGGAGRLKYSRSPAQYHYLLAARRELGGRKIEVFFLDSRPWKDVKKDPEGFLIMRDGRPSVVVKAKWVGPEGQRRIAAISMTNYDDAGNPGRFFQVDLHGIQLGCTNSAAPGRSPQSLAARLVRLVKPRELQAQSLTPCIPSSIWDVLKTVAFDALLSAINPAVGETAAMYDVLSVWDCVFSTYTIPRLGTVTVTCPPCFIEVTYSDVENPITGAIERLPDTVRTCPTDDECVSTYTP